MNQRNFAALLSAAAVLAGAACARTADAPAEGLFAVVDDAGAVADAGDAGSDAAPSAPPAVADAAALSDAAPTPEDAAPADGDANVADAGAATDPTVDGGSECVAGTYKGAFSGQVSFLPALLANIVAVDISGTISISVDTDSTGNLLTVRNGHVDGTDQDGNPVTAVVNGVLDCSTKQLMNGTLTEGKYQRTALLPVNFTGTVTADYNPDPPPSATGKWKTSGGFVEGGGGTWSAVLVP